MNDATLPAAGIAATALPVSTRVMNLATFLTQSARRLPDEIALVMGERRWTWAEFEARTDALAAALQDRLGLKKGDRVLCQSQNCPEMMQAMFAVWRAGGVWVPANFRQTPDEVAYQVQASGAVGLVCNAAFPDHAAACGDLGFTLTIGGEAFGTSLEALTEDYMGQRPKVAMVDRDDPCWFFFTSGTTGRPKASVLTHGQMAFVVTNHLADLMPGLTPADASLVVAPLSHGAGVHQLTQVARGVKTVLMPSEKFDVETVCALIAEWRVSTIFTVPTILKLIVEHPAAATADLSSLRYVIYAGAPMYREDQKRALEVLGPVLVQYFGLGEVTGAITVLPTYLHSATDDGLTGTCGFARTGLEVQVQDDSGNEVAPGETGELCVTGPAVFAGYWNNPKANAESFRNGWFRTGDLGHMDARGFFYITGRRSDMFISGGSNVYPREVEEKILTHPAISEVAVLGMPDPLWGEVGWAVCVPRDGATVTPEELAAHLDGKLSRYKLPRRFVLWEALPKSAYGKITKKMIREELERQGLTEGSSA